MIINRKFLQRFFLCCLGLFIGTAFCMKWMENDFLQNGEKFTIIGLEISYSKEKVSSILAGLDDHVRAILRYQLVFDFVFMAAVYPGIAALCLMAKNNLAGSLLKKVLLALAFLQIVAWGFDILENYYLLKWINEPVIGNEFGFYHFVVAAKWIIALSGALPAIPLALRKNRVIQKS